MLPGVFGVALPSSVSSFGHGIGAQNFVGGEPGVPPGGDAAGPFDFPLGFARGFGGRLARRRGVAPLHNSSR